jgi:hypothetical protein
MIKMRPVASAPSSVSSLIGKLPLQPRLIPIKSVTLLVNMKNYETKTLQSRLCSWYILARETYFSRPVYVL